MVIRIPAVGGVVCDGAGRVLLVLRARPPQAGRWSVPGGKVEAGESIRDAVAREVLEETGLRVTVGRLLGSVEIPASRDSLYEVQDYAATPVGGELRAGDDAADVRWFTRAQAVRLPVTDKLVELLDSYEVFAGHRQASPGSG